MVDRPAICPELFRTCRGPGLGEFRRPWTTSKVSESIGPKVTNVKGSEGPLDHSHFLSHRRRQ